MNEGTRYTPQTEQPKEVEISAEELQALQRNDGRVWGEIYERYTPKMLKVATKRVGPDNAEDIVHDVWIDFTELAQEGKLQADKLSHYLTRSVANRSVSLLRRQQRIRMHSFEDVFSYTNADGQTTPIDIPDRMANVEEDTINKVDNVAQLKAMFDKVPTDLRASVFFNNLGYSRNEVSEMTGVNPSTVATQAHRGLNYIFGKDRERRKKKPAAK